MTHPERPLPPEAQPAGTPPYPPAAQTPPYPSMPTDPATTPAYSDEHQDPDPGPLTGSVDRDPATVPQTADPAVAPPTQSRPAPGFDSRGHVKRTRISGVWVGLIGTALFLILLIIFIAQNSRQVSLHLFGWHGQFSLALTIILSAVIGILLVAIPGSVRIAQLRRALRRNVPDGKVRD